MKIFTLRLSECARRLKREATELHQEGLEELKHCLSCSPDESWGESDSDSPKQKSVTKADGSVSYTSKMIAEVLLFLLCNSTENVQRLDLNVYACLLWFCISWFGKTIKDNRQTSDSGSADVKVLVRKAAAARTMMHLTARTQRRPLCANELAVSLLLLPLCLPGPPALPPLKGLN